VGSQPGGTSMRVNISKSGDGSKMVWGLASRAALETSSRWAAPCCQRHLLQVGPPCVVANFYHLFPPISLGTPAPPAVSRSFQPQWKSRFGRVQVFRMHYSGRVGVFRPEVMAGWIMPNREVIS
jgi:hypothetical protein